MSCWRDELLGVRNDRFVVRGDAGVVAVGQQLLHQADVVRVDVLLVGKRDVGLFEIGALAEPDPGAEPDQVGDVVGGAAQRRLDHDAGMRAVVGEEPLLEEIERPLRVGRAFHVEADEAVELLGDGRESRGCCARRASGSMSSPIWVSLTETLTSTPAACIAPQHGEVGVARLLGLGGLRDALAEHVERGGDAPRRAAPGAAATASVDRLAGNETRGELSGQPVAAHEIEDRLAGGEPEQERAHHRRVGSWTGLSGTDRAER